MTCVCLLKDVAGVCRFEGVEVTPLSEDRAVVCLLEEVAGVCLSDCVAGVPLLREAGVGRFVWLRGER